MFDSVLVPLDGSKLAEQVFPAVIELANTFGMELHVVSVCGADEKEEGKTSYFYIHEVAANFKKRTNTSTDITTQVLYGKPSEQILHYTETEKINLIVMTSHGRSGIMPWSLGSTVNKVFEKASVPMIIVRAKEQIGETRLFRRIIVPLDGSENSAAILPYIKKLAYGLHSEVALIKVIEAGKHVRTIGGLDYVRFMEQNINMTKQSTKKALEAASVDLTPNKNAIKYEVRVGDPATEILKCAEEMDCTLIAMTSHGHHGIEAWSLGSVTSKIIAVAKQSVLMAPSFHRQ